MLVKVLYNYERISHGFEIRIEYNRNNLYCITDGILKCNCNYHDLI